ncbi:hypothetical protein HanIR_Chr05g0223601 [Helianthus annuus]|nr:hypothetical protein HanIR_Chr05g0223601 [Helianthus annuus]
MHVVYLFIFVINMAVSRTYFIPLFSFNQDSSSNKERVSLVCVFLCVYTVCYLGPEPTFGIRAQGEIGGPF